MMATLKSNQGTALISVLVISCLLLALTGSSLLFSGLNLKTTGILKIGTSALHAADAGIQHVLTLIPSGTDFNSLLQGTVAGFTCNSPCNGIANKPTFTGSLNGYTYAVVVENDPGDAGGPTNDTNNLVTLTSTAQDPNGNTTKVVVAYIGRGSYGLGATSLPAATAPNTETNFSGTSFSINGNDNCNAAPAVPGIVVTDPALKTEITNDTTSDGGLSSNQMSLVTGAGGTPSVATRSPLSQTVSQIADQYLTLTHTDLPAGNYSGTGSWGTSTTPQITQITGDAQITGNITGYGVLIVNGALDVAGNFTFNGLVIARGGDVAVQVTGNAGVYGSLLIAPKAAPDAAYELDVRGNAHVRYDSCALASANSWKPLPKMAKVTAWKEKF